MVLQKNKESVEISQWVFYRAERINPEDNAGENALPELKIALAFDLSGKIAKAIVTPFEVCPEEPATVPAPAVRG